MKKKKNFLKTLCPFRVLEERVTWGEFIFTYIKAFFGVAVFFIYYIATIAFADIVGVAG